MEENDTVDLPSSAFVTETEKFGEIAEIILRNIMFGMYRGLYLRQITQYQQLCSKRTESSVNQTNFAPFFWTLGQLAFR